MTASMDTDLDDVLEDSLSYSPLRDAANKENTPGSFMNSMDRIRQSPSTTRLFALLGSNQVNQPTGESPWAMKPKRLEDLLNTPSDAHTAAPKQLRSKEDLAAELRTLRSSMLMIQRDCEFHRKRALVAQDEVDNLHKYIQSLEDEKKNRLSPDSDPTQVSVPPLPSIDIAEIQALKLTITSLETLNKSLARQNDLLRSRPSLVGNRHSRKDTCVQTEVVHVDIPPDPIGEWSPHQEASYTSPFKMPLYTPPQSFPLTYVPSFTRKECCTQTETGVWATVEDLSDRRPLSRRIMSLGTMEKDQYISLPVPKVDDEPRMSRRSLPSQLTYIDCLHKGVPTGEYAEGQRPQVYVPNVSRQRERVRSNAIPGDQTRRSRRGVSTGSITSARQRSSSAKRIWLP